MCHLKQQMLLKVSPQEDFVQAWFGVGGVWKWSAWISATRVNGH
jgi:hypothetical protein